jgi:hypothetical protein
MRPVLMTISRAPLRLGKPLVWRPVSKSFAIVTGNLIELILIFRVLLIASQFEHRPHPPQCGTNFIAEQSADCDSEHLHAYEWALRRGTCSPLAMLGGGG